VIKIITGEQRDERPRLNHVGQHIAISETRENEPYD